MTKNSLFAGLDAGTDVAPEKDQLGGFGILESDIYIVTISLAYITFSAKKAMAINIHGKTDAGEQIQQTIYVSSGEDKGCKSYYEKSGKKFYLPGFLVVNAICLLSTGKELASMDSDKKTVNIYNYDQKKDVPTEVDVLPELHGQRIALGIIKRVENKNVKDTATGKYVPDPTGALRTINEIDKVFHPDTGLTTTEQTANATEPVFSQKWLKKWQGVTHDRSTKAPGTAGSPIAGGAAPMPGSGGAPKTSLFNK